MNRSLSLHPASLAVGLALGLVCLLSMSQVGVTTESWGPPKKDIVNLFEFPASPVLVSPNTSISVFAVPGDRWLTVTAASVLYTGGTLLWAQDSNGTLTSKGLGGELGALPTSPEGSGGPVGWTFAPGSAVVLSNPGSGGNTVPMYRCALVGYLSRQ